MCGKTVVIVTTLTKRLNALRCPFSVSVNTVAQKYKDHDQNPPHSSNFGRRGEDFSDRVEHFSCRVEDVGGRVYRIILVIAWTLWGRVCTDRPPYCPVQSDCFQSPVPQCRRHILSCGYTSCGYWCESGVHSCVSC